MNKDIIDLIPHIAALVAAIATIIGVYFKNKNPGRDSDVAYEKHTQETWAVYNINLARDELKHQQKLAVQNLRTRKFLILSQFLISAGLLIIGLLATFFNQNPLSGPVTGLLGLIVLSSLLIQLFYRPDARLLGASQRILKLKHTIEDASKKLTGLKAGLPGVPEESEIIKSIEVSLEEVEFSQRLEMELMRKKLSITNNDFKIKKSFYN